MAASKTSEIPRGWQRSTDIKARRETVLDKSIIFPFSSLSEIRITYATFEEPSLFSLNDPSEKTELSD